MDFHILSPRWCIFLTDFPLSLILSEFLREISDIKPKIIYLGDLYLKKERG